MSRDIPIIFSAPMVQALLAGRKTMTRRLAWKDYGNGTGKSAYTPSPWQKVQPGDRLWVRENWRADCPDDPTGAIYMADEAHRMPEGGKWRPSIHMPRWASRLTLEVTAVKIEKLKKMSEEDAISEGAEKRWLKSAAHAPVPVWEIGGSEGISATSAFELLWDKLHGAGSWDENPDVVALSFTVHQRNIDSLKVSP